MNNLLVLGCSYSHLEYHTNCEDSYTFHLKNELGFNNLINLSVCGAAPSTINRILIQYLDNPKFGIPDFVFIQWPYASRNEYFIDTNRNKCVLLYASTGKNVYSQISIKNINEEIEKNKPKSFLLKNSDWRSTHNEDEYNLLNAHMRLISNKSQQLINLYKEVGIAEKLLDNKIPYAYVESEIKTNTDKTTIVHGLLSQEHQYLNTYNYAKHLCHKKFFIPNVGIQTNSPTYANDNYDDGHPGPISHKRFADAIIPKLRELIQ